MANSKQTKQTKQATQATQWQQAKRPAGTNAPACTNEDVAKAQAANHWQAAVTMACGTNVQVVHVVRRRYAVLVAGKLAGYYTAALAGGNHTNALQRLYGNTLQTLKLH